MPGSPDPAFGSSALVFAVACGLATAAAAVPYALRARVSDPASAPDPTARPEGTPLAPSPRRLAALGGLAYAGVCLGLWAVARIATDGFGLAPAVAAPFLLVTLVVLAAQAGVPYYLAARFRLRAPLVGLFVASVAIGYAFLHVRGETDPVGLYVLFGPVAVVGCGLLGALEAGGRRLLGRRGGRAGGDSREEGGSRDGA